MQTTTMETTTVRAGIVLDVICAHSYLGYTRFARAADRMRTLGVRVEVDFLPFELAPGASAEGQPLLAVLEQVFGAQAAADTARFAEYAALDGLTLDYGRAIATGTFEAHRLIARAAAQGKAEPMVERLFRAHFTDGLHIGDPVTLAGLAAEIGVTADASGAGELRARLAGVRGRGITGVPVFLIGDLPPLTGAQPEEALLAALNTAARRTSLA